MGRRAVGVTGRLWRKVTDDERQAFAEMAEQGFSFRDIGIKFNREHHVVSYALKDERGRLLAAADRHRRRLAAKKKRATDEMRLHGKLYRCVHQARKRAERKGFDIDIDVRFLADLYLAQGGLCALTGLRMETGPAPDLRTNPHAVSLDRIDNARGYTRDNVRLVVWAINWALGEWGESRFTELAKTFLIHKYGFGGDCDTF